jgi:AraC-like DNA-binding protein
MRTVEFVQSFCLLPTIKSLRLEGANVEGLLAASELAFFQIENPVAALPLPRVNAFFEEIARSETGPGVPTAIARQYSLANLSDWGHFILACPDLLTACQTARLPEAGVLTNNRISLEINGAMATFNHHYTTSDSVGQQWSSMFSMFMTIDGFRAACGPDWMPLEMDVATPYVSALEAEFDLSGVVVRTDQRANRIRFRTTDLAQRMGVVSSDGLSMRHVPASSQARLVEIMDALNPDITPSQQVIAELMDMSPRTRQRRLTEEGVTFFGVIDRWRMGRATQLLFDPRLPVSEVATRLHYSNSSHFSRAFRRCTGMKPNEFRDSPLP